MIKYKIRISVIHNFEGIVNLIEGVVEFIFFDNERRSNVENGSTYPLEDTVFKEFLLELEDWFRVRILELFLDELSVLSDDVEGAEETFDSSLSETIVFLKEF